MNKAYVCKYCDTKTVNPDCICGNCRNKLPLVKELVKRFEAFRKLAKVRRTTND